MAFDPSTVDLSFVEPALRPEVVRRIIVLERYVNSRGKAAEKAACDELGISRHQLHVLARAWTSRRRAEDVTLRATKRLRPSSLDPRIITIIANAADAMPNASVREIESEVIRLSQEAGLEPPRYPTVNKYVRERMGVRLHEMLGSLDSDLVMDVIVCDIPVLDAEGQRIRPHLILLLGLDGEEGPLALGVTPGPLHPGTIMDVLSAWITRAVHGRAGCSAEVIKGLSVSVPANIILGSESHSIAIPHLTIEQRTDDLAQPGRIVTAALGTAIGGYKLRPRLVGAPKSRRMAGYPDLRPADAQDAASYLLAIARDGRNESGAAVQMPAGRQRSMMLAAMRRLAGAQTDGGADPVSVAV